MLTKHQRRKFLKNGYLIIPQCVPESLLTAADEEIDRTVAAAPPPAGTTGNHFYFVDAPELPAADAALRQSAALGYAEELTAPYPLHHGYGHIQIALNIPDWEHTPGGPHLDGYHVPDQPDPFALLGGIFLGDETTHGRGNLWVWPGSHLAHADLFRRAGINALEAVGGHSTMLDPPLDIGRPVPVLAERGDLLLAHYLLGHNSGGNTGDHIRRILYYRLSADGYRSRFPATMTDPFSEFPSLRDLG